MSSFNDNIPSLHGQFESPLQSWRLESPTLNNIFIAIVTTILSYQVSSLMYDLTLGLLKPRYVSTASDFHAVILTDESSIKSVCAALLRIDWLDRFRFSGKIPRGTTIAREPRHVKKRITAKLFFLLLTAPVVNILAVVITLERDQEISFAEAKFGAMGVGVNEDFSILPVSDFTGFCRTIPFKVDDYQHAKATFIWCNENSATKDSDGSWLSVETVSDEIALTLVVSGIQYSRRITIDLEVTEDTFRIRQRMSEEMTRSFIEFGNRELSRFCLRNGSSVSDVIRGGAEQTGMRLSRNVSCIHIGWDAAELVLTRMAGRVTLVKAESFEVVKHKDLAEGKTEYMKTDDLLLLEQRTSYVGLGTLFVATGCAVVLRIIVKLLLTKNDVHDGITALMRACFGAQSGDSLLWWNGIVRYDHKHQKGKMAHFGVRNDELPEVKEFEGGTVGIVDERCEVLVERCITLTE